MDTTHFELAGLCRELSNRSLEAGAAPFELSATSLRCLSAPLGLVGQSLKVCTLKSTLLAVLRNLAKNKLHRLWVVDDAGKPLGVISCTDIMNLIAGE